MKKLEIENLKLQVDLLNKSYPLAEIRTFGKNYFCLSVGLKRKFVCLFDCIGSFSMEFKNYNEAKDFIASIPNNHKYIGLNGLLAQGLDFTIKN